MPYVDLLIELCKNSFILCEVGKLNFSFNIYASKIHPSCCVWLWLTNFII